MTTVQIIRCPNCGSKAERHHLSISQTTRTECPICDYLMVNCSRTGRVIEAYSPGIYPAAVVGERREARGKKQEATVFPSSLFASHMGSVAKVSQGTRIYVDFL